MPFSPTPGLDDLRGNDIDEYLGEGAPLGIAIEMVGRFVPPEVRVQDHRQEQVVAVVYDENLAARSFDGRVVDQVLLGAVGADVPLEGELAGDDLLDRDLLFPAVAAVAFLAARLRDFFRLSEGALRFGNVRFTRRHAPIISGRR